MRENRHGRCGARYPERGTLLVRERDGRRFVGNYVREAGVWSHSSWRHMESLLAMYLEDTWAPMTVAEHPFLTRIKRRREVTA